MSAPASLDGVLLIDKPSGPTSHDVVARLRRVMGQRGIGHTGTLDPLASGLLALVLGRATRLASLLTSSDKTYEATIRLGFATTTDDALGERLNDTGSLKTPGIVCDSDVLDALEHFRGTFEQRPPNHSAKKVAGVKAYELARQSQPVNLTPSQVTVRSLEWVARTGDILEVRVTATAGFYVRALARDIGARLGCGAHLMALRRVRSGAFRVEDALPLADAERAGAALGGRLLTPASALPNLTSVVLTDEGLRRVLHGNWIGRGQWLQDEAAPAVSDKAEPGLVKLLAPGDNRLVALAKTRPGALHPVVVLG
jgi:tRNA pseudouridine55 synthase